jgi:HEPN domain-containing protein
MIPRSELKRLARTRLKDAEVLSSSKRYDGAIYLCGYAIELALKARICRTLNWPEFPETNAEFRELQTFKTHNLDTLLRLSAIETKIKSKSLAEWSIVAAWEPELRYRIAGTATQIKANDMIQATRTLLGVI